MWISNHIQIFMMGSVGCWIGFVVWRKYPILVCLTRERDIEVYTFYNPLIDGTSKLLKVPRICFFQSLSLTLSGKALLESIKFSTFHFAFKILKAFLKTKNWMFKHYLKVFFADKKNNATKLTKEDGIKMEVL